MSIPLEPDEQIVWQGQPARRLSTLSAWTECVIMLLPFCIWICYSLYRHFHVDIVYVVLIIAAFLGIAAMGATSTIDQTLKMDYYITTSRCIIDTNSPVDDRYFFLDFDDIDVSRIRVNSRKGCIDFRKGGIDFSTPAFKFVHLTNPSEPVAIVKDLVVRRRGY
jgi:hypothetical protein